MRSALVLFALVTSSLPAIVHAHDGVGAVRIGGGVPLFGWSDGRTTFTGEPTIDRSGFSVGLLTPAFPLDVAVVVAPWIAVGARARLRYTEDTRSTLPSPSAVTTDTFDYQALAYVEASFRVDVARPFLRVAGGVSGAQSSSGVTQVSNVLGTFAVYLGVHLFVDSAFSISPHFGLEYSAGNGNAHDLGMAQAFGYDYVQVFLGVELMGWIGGATPER